jgi:hypothetical protein
MSTELAKIVALYIISLQLKYLAVDKRELYVFWLGLFAVTGESAQNCTRASV